MAMNLKELIDLGCTLEMPYKHKDIMEWFQDSIKLGKIDEQYYVYVPRTPGVYTNTFSHFDSFDAALEKFTSYKDNVGVLQLQVSEEHPEWDDVEVFEEEYRAAVKKKLEELDE